MQTRAYTAISSLRRVLPGLALILNAALGLAQTPAPRDSVACNGLTVQAVDVDTHRPPFKGLLGWWRKFARALGLHHETTSRELVRRFVTLDPGDACTAFRRSESERILRAQPFLADAKVVAHRAGGDSVRVAVATIDEVPVVGGGRIYRGHIDAISLGTMNFLGAGARIEGRWERGRAYHDGYGARLGHNQLFGRPYEVRFDGMRHPIGEDYSAQLSHPFFTDLQRIAWHSGYHTSKEFTHLRQQDRTELATPLNRTIWNAGAVYRFGSEGRLALVGAMVLGEHLLPSNDLFMVDTINGFLTPTTDTLRSYEKYNATHFGAVLGLRQLTFSTMRGLDALVGEQDIATGTQVGGIFGTEPDRVPLLHRGFASIDVYSGHRTTHGFFGVRTDLESRLDLTKRQWRHLVASGRAAYYYKPSPRWTSELALEAVGGWRTIMPFQLELGARDGGVAGYARSLESGAQRVVLRAEQRFYVGEFRKRVALGAAAFGDAGRVWAGDAPFGVTTPVRPSLGFAVLGAFPVQSQRTIRAEFAVPMSRASDAHPELRLTIREPIRGFWIDPPRVRWLRLSAVPEQIFSWP